MINKIKRAFYLAGVVLAATFVFFFSFKQQAGVSEPGNLSHLDMETIGLAYQQNYELLSVQLDWVEADHADSARSIAHYIRGFKTDLSRQSRFKVANLIVKRSRRYHFNPYFIVALMQVESTFRNGAVSSVGAMGLMQVRPFVAKSLAAEMGLPWKGPSSLYNPYFNVKVGIYYLYKLRVRFKDHVNAMVAAYNYGPTRIALRTKRLNRLPQKYYRKVASVMSKIEAQVGRRSIKERGVNNWTI